MLRSDHRTFSTLVTLKVKINELKLNLLRDITYHVFFRMLTDSFSQSETVIEGEFEIGTQYHFYMETLVAVCIPVEDGINVFCSTQDQDAVQNAIARCLKLHKAQ